jgi:hypothetical protein
MAVKAMKWANKKSHCSNMGRLLAMCKTKSGARIVGNKNARSAVGRKLQACKTSKNPPAFFK